MRINEMCFHELSLFIDHATHGNCPIFTAIRGYTSTHLGPATCHLFFLHLLPQLQSMDWFKAISTLPETLIPRGEKKHRFLLGFLLTNPLMKKVHVNVHIEVLNKHAFILFHIMTFHFMSCMSCMSFISLISLISFHFTSFPFMFL